MNNGWIKLHRKFLNWEWWEDHNTTRLFLYLIIAANHKQKRWKGNVIDRGQVLTGINSLSQQTGISIQSIRTSLERLKSTNEITIKSTNKFSIVTVCNYESYQIKDTDTNKLTNNQLTNNQQSTNNQLTTTKNVKNVKNEREGVSHDSLAMTIREFYIQASDDQMWLEIVAMQNGHQNLENTKRLLTLFCNQLKSDGEDMKTYSDGKKHFSRWSSYKKNKKLVVKEVAI